MLFEDWIKLTGSKSLLECDKFAKVHKLVNRIHTDGKNKVGNDFSKLYFAAEEDKIKFLMSI